MTKKSMKQNEVGYRRAPKKEDGGPYGLAMAGAERLWTVSDIAGFLGFTSKGIYGLVERQSVPCLRIGSRLRFEPDVILEWIRQRRISPIEK